MVGPVVAADDLRPLDVLLYRPSSAFGYAIRLHTGHNISHVEVFLGDRVSTASRDGKGVNRYPVRLDHLAYVMRPRPGAALNLSAATALAVQMTGTPYGWLDLLDFFGWNVNATGIVCSPYATLVARAGGLDVFNGSQARLVMPFQFRTSERYDVAWTDGADAALDAAAA